MEKNNMAATIGKKYVGLLLSIIATAIIIVVTSLISDFYFDLNDDVLMKDILSGVYTGTPEGHNIQMLYLISAFISIPYRLFSGLDWYGIFLCAVQFLCIFVIIFRSQRFVEHVYSKIALAVVEVLIFLGLMLNHLLIVQYTFACALMSATTAFLFLTSRKDMAWRIGSDIFSLVLIWIAYLIRSEMLLLTLPMTGLAFCYRINMEISDLSFVRPMLGQKYNATGYENDRTFYDIAKYFLIMCLALVVGIGACQLSHRIAYGSAEWKEFTAFFDNRTELYDFQTIPDYETNSDFYDEIGITQAEQELLVNYNFGLDTEIDSKLVGEIADYAASIKTDEEPLLASIMNVIPAYIYRLHAVQAPMSYEYPMTDYPYNLVVIVLYLAVFVIYLLPGKKDNKVLVRFAYIFFELFLLFVCRTTLWGYILVRGRDPIRITHSLYLVESAVLAGMLFKKMRELRRRDKIVGSCIISFLLLTVTVPAIYFNADIIAKEDAGRIMTNASYKEIYSYCRQNSENFYFFDVYSTTTYTEKMFENVDNSEANYDVMGGWASKSPLYQKKLESYGFTDMQSALLLDNVYFVLDPVNSVEADTQWLIDYYADQDIKIETELVDTISGFQVYGVTQVVD